MPPTPFQRKIFWAAITGVSFVALGAVVTLIGKLVFDAISFLQPLLIPIAIAGILAYLLEPAVQWLEERKVSRTMAVVAVFFAITAVSIGIIGWVAPALWRQGEGFAHNLPHYTQRTQELANKTITKLRSLQELPFLNRENANTPTEKGIAEYVSTSIDNGITWLQEKAPDIAASAGSFLRKSVGGFLGVFGFLLSLILVPIFLFFFLKEAPSITANWSKYLPLRASPLKSEIVSLLNEINRYLINFFRGQLIVSLIDGALIGVSLMLFVQLDFALLIGLMVGVLGLIPYAGMMICWVPAVIIAAAQYGDWWHPMLVTIIFVGANQLEGIFLSPKIVGDSVGLHPLTVIISVLAWSLVLGGLLGALLAVPLTATLKVLLKRYFWDRPSSRTDAASMAAVSTEVT